MMREICDNSSSKITYSTTVQHKSDFDSQQTAHSLSLYVSYAMSIVSTLD